MGMVVPLFKDKEPKTCEKYNFRGITINAISGDFLTKHFLTNLVF